MKRLIIVLTFLPLIAFSQNLNYARQVIDTLASPAMAGRAYCTDGNDLAAKYIISQLKQNHLLPLTDDYMQHFKVAKNCILDSVYLFAGRKRLRLGVDYLIEGSTPTIMGNYKLLYIHNPKRWKKIARKKNLDSTFVVVNYNDIQKLKKDKKEIYTAFRFNRLEAAGIIILKDNFYYVPKASQSYFPLIYMKPGALPADAQSISIYIRSKIVVNANTQNILAYIPGQIDSFIVFSAHYDHLGRLGQVYFPGANDNASGVAMLLDLAHTIANRKTKPKYNVAFMFFSGEELGLLGSSYYVEHPVFDLKKIKLLINLDMVGSGSEGITVVNGKDMPAVVEKMKKTNEQMNLLPDIKVRPNAPNSDHYPFTKAGVPAIFIYTRGQYKEYHNIFDQASRVPLTEFTDLEKLLYNFLDL